MATSTTADAAESVVPITQPGSTDTDQAFLPPVSGFYGGVTILPINRNSRNYDSEGNPAPSERNIKLSVPVYAAALVYVYPFTLFGGHLASSWVQPFEHISYSIGGENQTAQTGLGNAYSDVVFWTKSLGLAGATPGHLPISYGLSVAAGLAAIVPDGSYNRQNALNLGSDFWTLVPNIAITYNTGERWSFGDNTQVSTRIFYGIPFENRQTHYTSGNIFDLDWSVTEQFGNLRIGAAGFYQAQVTDDTTGDGVPVPGGNRFHQAAAGPVIQYFVPSLRMYVKAKYVYTFYHKNFVNQQLLALTVAFKF
ncbi:transporter [Burkholderia sp. Bp9140]|uniref:SphA family protein n=1 Tax=Burkholderia sp. Bp9140 TaxID=2184572 RepID=UPI00162889A7|nr:transporter [Burkholderia sp. Bp9140]